MRGVTFYKLFEPEDLDTERVLAQATFRNLLLCPLDGLGDGALVHDRGRATVEVAFEAPAVS